MNEKKKHDATTASPEEVSAVAKKVEDWGKSLPSREQALVQTIVSRALAIEADDVRKHQLRDSIKEATLKVFRDVNRRVGVEGWVEIGPIWVKANRVEFGEEVEIIQRAATRQQRG